MHKTLLTVKRASACLEEVLEAGRLTRHLKRHLFLPRLENIKDRLSELFTAWTALFSKEEAHAIQQFIETTYSTAAMTRDAQVRDLQERRFAAELENQFHELRKTIIYGSEQASQNAQKIALQTRELRRRLEGLSIDTLGKDFQARHLQLGSFEQSRTPGMLVTWKC